MSNHFVETPGIWVTHLLPTVFEQMFQSGTSPWILHPSTNSQNLELSLTNQRCLFIMMHYAVGLIHFETKSVYGKNS
jgi:hypothetical protein